MTSEFMNSVKGMRNNEFYYTVIVLYLLSERRRKSLNCLELSFYLSLVLTDDYRDSLCSLTKRKHLDSEIVRIYEFVSYSPIEVMNYYNPLVLKVVDNLIRYEFIDNIKTCVLTTKGENVIGLLDSNVPDKYFKLLSHDKRIIKKIGYLSTKIQFIDLLEKLGVTNI